MFRNFKGIIEGSEINQVGLLSCGDLGVISAIRNSPPRIKCAPLPRKTLEKVLTREELLV